MLVDYDKSWAELNKALERSQEFFIAHHMQVEKEKIYVKELEKEIGDKDLEMEEIRATLERVLQENRELKAQVRGVAPMKEKIQKMSAKLGQYQTIHQAMLQAIRDNDENKESLAEFLEDYQFPTLEDDAPAASKKNMYRSKSGPKAPASNIAGEHTENGEV